MMMRVLRVPLIICFAALMLVGIYIRVTNHKTILDYVPHQCMPCGQPCDTLIFTQAGSCTHCHMPLVTKQAVRFKSILPIALCTYIKLHPATVLLDVRTKEEFERKADPDFGTLKQAINIPIQELESRLPEIQDLKEKEIIVYCSHSHRSPQASYILTQNGFTNIINMEGGLSVLQDTSCLQ